MQAFLQDRMRVPRLWLVALALWFAVTMVAGIALWHLRHDALAGQARELSLLSLALTDEIERGLHGAEEGLHAMRIELREGRLQASGAPAEQALHTRAELMPLARTLWLVERDGRLLAASDATPTPDLRSFSPTLEHLADNAIAVSRPFLDQNPHESLVALAVRFAGPPGDAGGWVLAAMPATELLGAFAVAAPAADARMAVYRSDGVRLAGSIVATPTLDEASVARRLARLQDMEVRKLLDGSERLVASHGLPRYGLKVVLTRNLEAVLVPWRKAAQFTAIGIALFLVITAVSAHLVGHADRRRAQSQRALQAQLSRASKLESLGTLAGGVAHDFNNVLAAIVGFSEMAHDGAVPGSDQTRHLDKVMQAALRGKALVGRILAFSRGGARTSVVFELQPVVEEALGLLAASLRPGIVVERELDALGARLRGDPTQVFEAVVNLCSNAMQAMPGGGMLSIQLKRRHIALPCVLSHSKLNAGDYLSLAVSDQGPGIDPKVMERLFEPFFTTRGAHAGTGLGLPVVHGAVAEFDGAIDVQSTPAHGARFTLYLSECTDALGSAPPLPTTAPRGAGQSLLVVDDEPSLVTLAVELLKGLGYEPLGYRDPVAALEELRKDPQRFAAIITDEVMPGLSGTQLTEALRIHAPHLPVLLVSGYGGALLAQRAATAGVTRVLAKPLQRAELARALAELLR